MDENIKGTVFDIQRYSVHDGPGIRTLVFLKGCPLRCKWCANPEGLAVKQTILFESRLCYGCGECINACQTGAIYTMQDKILWDQDKCINCLDCASACKISHARQVCGRKYNIPELLGEIEKDLIFFRKSGGGLTVGGGEPMLQAEFAAALMSAVHEELRVSTAVETSSYGPWEKAKMVYENCDTIQTDIKHMDDRTHRRLTGVSNASILSNITGAAKNLNRDTQTLIIRIPVIPGMNDTQENIRSTAEFAASLGCVERLELLPYHNLGESKYDSVTAGQYQLHGLKRPKDTYMEELRQLADSCGVRACIGGQ